MRRWMAGFLGPAFFVAACALGALAREATIESSVVFDVQQASLQLNTSWTLPLARLSPNVDLLADNAYTNELFLRHTLQPDGEAAWGASVSLASPPLSARLFFHEPHDAGSDPFRLIHSSVRHDEGKGFSLKWHTSWPVHLQYVSRIPVRRATGPLISARIGGDEQPLRLTTVLYGSHLLRHRFIVLDGDVRVGGVRVAWGAAKQDGVELHDSDGGVPRRNVDEAAAFVRLEGGAGRHRGWVLVSATSPSFRSLAASTYPFRRGAVVTEGRWQWRPATNRLVSVFAERRRATEGTVYEALEASFSVMPRGGWGWRVGWDGSRESGGTIDRTWRWTVTSPDRRLEQTVAVSVDAVGEVRRQWRLQLSDADWRVRLSADDGLPAARLEWRWAPEGWTVTFVYKARWYAERGVASWLHASLAHDIAEVGQWWVQWREPDRGRLDVGWSRPATVGAGVRVFF